MTHHPATYHPVSVACPPLPVARTYLMYTLLLTQLRLHGLFVGEVLVL